MKICHIADVHLGYRAYSKLTSRGINQREADVFRAFESVLKDACESDLVIIAGDLFHSVRPSNYTIFHAYRLLREFRERCHVPVVIVGGNHDTPKSLEAGCILDLLATIPGVHVHHHGFGVVTLDSLDTAVYCLPYFTIPEKNTLDIRPHDRGLTNVLAVHGTVEGVMRGEYDPEDMRLSPSELHFDDWNYVAFGHYHIHSIIKDNACYSGAIEYTSTNIWEECPDGACSPPPKGYVVFDTDSCEISHHQTPNIRTVKNLARVHAASLTASELMESIEGECRCLDDIDMCVGRIVIEGFARQLHRELDWTRLRELRSKALFLDIVFRASPAADSVRADSDANQQGLSLEDEWSGYVRAMDSLPAGVKREKLDEMGRLFLAKAAELEASA